MSSLKLQICVRSFRKPETCVILMMNIWSSLHHYSCPKQGSEDNNLDFISHDCIQNEELHFLVQNLSRFFGFIASPASWIGNDFRQKGRWFIIFCGNLHSISNKLSAFKLSFINVDQSGFITLHVELNIVNLCRHLEHMNILVEKWIDVNLLGIVNSNIVQNHRDNIPMVIGHRTKECNMYMIVVRV